MKRGDSWVWSSILLGRDLLKKEGRRIVGVGTTLDIRRDNWLASGAKAIVVDSSYPQSIGDCIDSSSNVEALQS